MIDTRRVVRRTELTQPELEAYQAGQLLPHTVTARVHLVDRDHRLLQDLSGHFVDGQTDVQDAPVNRTATASFADPDRDIADGAGFGRHHMLQAWSLVQVTTLGVDVLEPVFCGPLTGKAQAGATTTVNAEDKAMLALTDVPSDFWLPKTRAVDVLTDILAATGEERIAFPRGINDKIRERVAIGPEEELYPMNVALRVAAGFGMQLYYDTEGWARLREQPERPTFTYRSGTPDANVVDGDPDVAEDWADRPNRVLLRGGKGLTVVSELAPGNESSPGALGRGGTRPGTEPVPYRVTEIVENDKISEKDRGTQLTERTLTRSSGAFADVTFSAVPARHVEVLDVQRLVTEDASYTFVFDEGSIPWLGGAMSVGYQRRVSKAPGRIRTKATRRVRKKDQNDGNGKGKKRRRKGGKK